VPRSQYCIFWKRFRQGGKQEGVREPFAAKSGNLLSIIRQLSHRRRLVPSLFPGEFRSHDTRFSFRALLRPRHRSRQLAAKLHLQSRLEFVAPKDATSPFVLAVKSCAWCLGIRLASLLYLRVGKMIQKTVGLVFHQQTTPIGYRFMGDRLVTMGKVGNLSASGENGLCTGWLNTADCVPVNPGVPHARMCAS
jgi:hypothetical protein